MYSTVNGELPSIGKVDLAWVQTPLPPVTIKTAPPAKAENVDEINMDDGDGDAMMQESQPVHADGHRQEQQELDYDVADDNDWGIS
jgi:hypothetical protein